jgi:hypothetical protein
VVWADRLHFCYSGSSFFQFNKFCHAVAALKHDSLLLIADIIRALLEDPYAAVRAHLLASHRLTDYQWAEKLVAMQALGARRPSQLMAAMLEMCSAGDEKSKIFPALFLQRLPAQLGGASHQRRPQ